MIRDFRKWLGKTGNKFTGTLLEQCALTLGTRKDLLNVAGRSGVNAGGSTESAPDEESVHIDYISCEVFVFAMETNLFGPGPPQHCNTRWASKGRERKGRRQKGVVEVVTFQTCLLQEKMDLAQSVIQQHS